MPFRWEKAPVIAPDVEATGLSWHTDKVFGVAVAWLEDGQIKSEYFDVRDEPAKYARFKKIAPTIKKAVNHNIKYDLHMLLNDGIVLDPARCHCTMIRECLIDEHQMLYGLDECAYNRLGKRKDETIWQELAAIFGGKPTKHYQAPNLHRAPPALVARYAIKDAELALELFIWQEAEMVRQGLERIYALETRLFPHVFSRERHGIRVDTDEAERRMVVLGGEISRKRTELDRMAGFPINPNPSGSIHELFKPVQISDKLFRLIDGTITQATDAGKASIGAETLQAMRHPCAKLILDVRKIMRLRDTFLAKHVLEHSVNGRVHPNINQVKGEDGGTGTGRLSYTGPALQQIPSRDKEMARLIRPVFIPDEDQGWSYGDLDQHELRIFHHYVKNPRILAAYKADPDLDGHQAVADLTGLPRDANKSGDMRNAKQMNLAMVFNMGGGELAAAMGMPYTVESFGKGGKKHEYKKAGPEAQAIIDRYYEMMPGVKEIAKEARSIAQSRGYVQTIHGRHIRFPGGMFTYKASGLVYQGTAADLNKENICMICEYLASESKESNLLLNIHDEYSMSMPFGHAKHLNEIKRLIQDRPQIRVPLRIDFSELSSNWWDATIAPLQTGGKKK